MDEVERRQRRIQEKAGIGDVDFRNIIPPLSRDELLSVVDRFLEDAGYDMRPPCPIGSATPDFYGQRMEGEAVYNLVGVICMDPADVPTCCDRLLDIRTTLGHNVDYVLAAHQMPEYLLCDILEADRGRLYHTMKENELMMWVCFSTDEGERVWCFLGGSRDKLLEGFFRSYRELTAEVIIGPRISDMLLEEEDF